MKTSVKWHPESPSMQIVPCVFENTVCYVQSPSGETWRLSPLTEFGWRVPVLHIRSRNIVGLQGETTHE